MIMCVLLCYPVSIHMSQLLSTGRPISSIDFNFFCFQTVSRKWVDRSIHIWHVVVTGIQGVSYFKVTLNSHL